MEQVSGFIEQNIHYIALILLVLLLISWTRSGKRCGCNKPSTVESYKSIALQHMFGQNDKNNKNTKEGLSYASDQKYKTGKSSEHFGGPGFTYAEPKQSFSASNQHLPFVGNDYL